MVTTTEKSSEYNQKSCNKPKSVFVNQNKRLLEKYDLIEPKDCFYLNQCLKKLKKTVSTSRNKIF